MVQHTNHWPDDRCAKAFWGQEQLPAYQQLLADTIAWTDPKPGSRWLDLGCGGGRLTEALWHKGNGQIETIVGIDIAAKNQQAYAHLSQKLGQPSDGPVRFRTHNFSEGLAPFDASFFGGVVSGLSITYAESFDEAQGMWTTKAYDRLLREVHRVLRPGGQFVFSVNVPEPNWSRIARSSMGTLARAKHPLRSLKKAWRMYRYGSWLKKEARKGRFQYLPARQVEEKLQAAGFIDIEHRISYAEQAFIFRAQRSDSPEAAS